MKNINSKPTALITKVWRVTWLWFIDPFHTTPQRRGRFTVQRDRSRRAIEETTKQHTQYVTQMNAAQNQTQILGGHSQTDETTDSDRALADHQITCWSCANACDSLAARAKPMPTWMKGWMSWSQPKPVLRLWSGRLLCFGHHELKQGSYLHYCYYLWWIAPCCLELLYIRAGWSYTSAFWPAFLSTSVGG